MSTILAVDQSTSATKALLFDTRGNLLDKTALEHQQYYPQPGWVEHDAEEIYQNTLKVLHHLLNKHSSHDMQCLSITNQRETFVIFDKGTGQPLYNAIVWQCRRGEPICTQLEHAGYGDQVHAITGLKIDTYFPASKIQWLLDARPDLKQKLASGDALLGTIDTYLIYRLTNGSVFASDHTNASRTLLYDIHQLAWSTKLCELFGIPVQALPEVRESSAHFGSTDLGGKLDVPIPICGVMGDSQAALFAEHCFTPGKAKVTFGTGSSILLNIGEHITPSPNGIVTTIGWVYDGKPTYAFEGIINFTGATIAWMCDQMQYIESPAETEFLAQQVEDNGGVYLIPAFVGLSAPYWKPNAKAAIVGLTPASTKYHIVRAALESIAYQVKDVLDLMTQNSAVQLQHIHGDGGMVSNHFLMQFVANMAGYTVRASRLPELSALGAVMSGLLGLNLYQSIADLDALPHTFEDYQPSLDKKTVQHYYDGWRAAVQQVLV
jgi:glycerol kinase